LGIRASARLIDSLVNPIYRVMPQSTRLPAIAFPLIGFFALFAGRRRYAYAARGISIHGFIDGAARVVGLVVTLTVLCLALVSRELDRQRLGVDLYRASEPHLATGREGAAQ
jgi:hypothetical protein